MTDQKYVISHTLPAWYHLRFDEDNRALLIDLHPDSVEYLSQLSKKTPVISYFEKDTKGAFMDSGDHWGFNGGGDKVASIFTDWGCLRFNLPQDGNRHDLKVLATNLHILFSQLYVLPKATNSNFQQLYKVITYSTKEGMGHAGFIIDLSVQFYNWLHTSAKMLPQYHHLAYEKAVDTMHTIFNMLHLGNSHYDRSIEFSLSGQLRMPCSRR